MRSWADGPLLGFDLETTGPDPLTALPVSWAICHFEPDEESEAWDSLLNPGVPIPPEATAIHGIRDQDVIGQWGPEFLAAIAVTLNCASVPIVGMNLAYDLTIVQRFGELSLHRLTVLDLQVIDKHVDPYRKGKRTLTDLCAHYGVEHGGTHNAVEDVKASVRCLQAVAKRYGSIARLDPRVLHEQQVRWADEQLRSLSAWRKSGGQPEIAESEYGWPIRGARPPVLGLAAASA